MGASRLRSLRPPSESFAFVYGRDLGANVLCRVKEEGGTHRISHLTLDGDESLFSA